MSCISLGNSNVQCRVQLDRFIIRSVILSAVMKRKAIIFSQLQNFKKSKYPEFLKNILIETAFDTAAALRTINKSTIEEIEKIVNQRTNLLKDTSYIDETGNLIKTPFKFMLGHESLLLRLPNDVDAYLSRKTKSICEIPTIDDLKVSFVERIKIFAERKNIALTLSSVLGSVNLSEFTHKENIVKCVANCPFCLIKICCSYKSNWKICNYNKHILSCAEKAARLNPQIERATPAVVLHELKNALR